MTTPSPLPNNPPMPIHPDMSGYVPSSPGYLGSGNTGNPVLDEISTAHANLSPQAQQAIEGAHGMLGISPAHSDPALAASAAPSPEVAVPGVSGPRGPLPILSPEIPSLDTKDSTSPVSIPGAQGEGVSIPQSPPMPINPHQAEYERLTKPPLNPSENASAHTSADSGRPGYEQIHNPWLRGLATVGNVIASGVFPRFGQFIPGTSGYHNNLVASQKSALGEEQAGAKSAAEVAREEAQTEQAKAQAGEATARASSLTNPPDPKEWTQVTEPIIDPAHPDNGPQVAYVNKNDPTKIQFLGQAAAKPTEDKTAASVHVLPDGTVVSVTHDAKTGASKADVVYKGDPKEAPPKVVQLEKNGKPHQVLVKEDGTEIKDLGETGEKPPTVNVNAETGALDRESTHYAKTHDKAVTDANSQLDKIADARAMVNGSAEAQATGIPKVLTALVSGAGSGVRITQPELNMIAKARGIGGDVEAFVQKLSSGKKLTPDQQKQLTGLLDDVHDRVIYKQGIEQEALDKINSGASRNEIIAADKDARKLMADYEGGTVKMKAPDGTVKQVPSDQAIHYKSMGAVQVP